MRTAPLALVAAAAAVLAAAPQRGSLPASESGAATRIVTYAEARPVADRLAPELAASVAARPEAERERAWREWTARRKAETRARLERGDEDSLINLLLFGTSFTTLPRARNDGSSLGGNDAAARLVRGRIADLVAGMAAPAGNERLAFARDVLARRGIDPATAEGRAAAAAYMRAVMKRAAGEAESYERTLGRARAQGRGELAVRATLFRERGLSSDTSLRPDFAIRQALEALRARGILDAGTVRRVAIVGPGLDFTDKAEGHDFYPQQTTQPFLVIDSLRRARLAHPDGLTATTIDLSPRVNGHLRAAQQRAAEGTGYVLVLPRRRDERWSPDLARFWETAGGTIGAAVGEPPAPGAVEVRAVRVHPDVVRSLRVRDVDIVVERLDAAADEARFDLVVATNVLVYYDVFEQSLALLNIAAMLRPGGVLLSNDVLIELPTTPIRSLGHTDAIYSERPDDRDQVVWYQRQ